MRLGIALMPAILALAHPHDGDRVEQDHQPDQGYR